MDNRFPQTLNHGGIADVRNVIQQFGSLKLGNDGNLEVGAVAPTPQEASDKILPLPENSVLDHGSLCGRNLFMNPGNYF